MRDTGGRDGDAREVMEAEIEDGSASWRRRSDVGFEVRVDRSRCVDRSVSWDPLHFPFSNRHCAIVFLRPKAGIRSWKSEFDRTARQEVKLKLPPRPRITRNFPVVKSSTP